MAVQLQDEEAAFPHPPLFVERLPTGSADECAPAGGDLCLCNRLADMDASTDAGACHSHPVGFFCADAVAARTGEHYCAGR